MIFRAEEEDEGLWKHLDCTRLMRTVSEDLKVAGVKETKRKGAGSERR